MDLSVPTNSKKLFELAIDFENFKKFSPAQIKDISIIEKSDDVITTEEILTFKTILKDIEIKQDPQYVRPTAVPRLIGDTTKFRKLTGWEPKIGIDDILNDTLQYWRDFIKNNDY